MTGTVVVGFDSAWTDNARAPGALCVLRQTADGWRADAPMLARFDAALAVIAAEAAPAGRVLVAIDQPTIVPNALGSRPADNVAASVVSFIGGGVQPANRGKLGMFDDAAPIWRFKAALGASDDAEAARTGSGTFLMEVFPALALASFSSRFYARRAAARYNPANRKTFRPADWLSVVVLVTRLLAQAGITGLEDWCARHAILMPPRKADQDCLDAVLCALIGHHWLTAPRSDSVMIGDLTLGYMVVPASPEVRSRLTSAARLRQVPIDGVLPVLD